MKFIVTFVYLLFCAVAAHGQVENTSEQVVVSISPNETVVHTDAKGVLHVTVAREDVLELHARGFVQYGDFGASGDGKTDDIDAIAAAHAFANQQDLPVKADEEATYHIGGKERTAVIQTDTDFGTAEFIIDDRDVQNHAASVFVVASSLQPMELTGISSLEKNQEKIDVELPGPSLVTASNSHVRRYIRFGPNLNDGVAQTDIFVVDGDGNVDEGTPIIWDFDQITEISALPMDETTLHITGGRFTTIANQAETQGSPYYSRNIDIRRSNVVVDGLEHRVTGEGEHGAPYRGFISIRDAANVTVQNVVLTGRKTYRAIGSAGVPVARGSYDISVNRALNVSFVNCSQTNDINDPRYWGIMASNYSKNIVYDNCSLSRFDAHMGVANATIRNSTLGYMGINAIGSGVLTVENSTIYGPYLVNLRSDYGSTWQGEVIIRDTVFVPARERYSFIQQKFFPVVSPSLIYGYNNGNHDFGYTAHMPERITIESLHIDDSNRSEGYQGPVIFADLNPEMTDESFHEEFPYVRTKTVILKDVTTASGKPLRVSDNPFMFKDVQIETD